jgi:uncharacterized protein YbcI
MTGASANRTPTEVALADELLELHRNSYGRGAGTANVQILDDMVVCILDDIELLPNEEFMVEIGKGDLVVETRSQYQEALETTFRAAVERATGRRVSSFASRTKLNPHYTVEIFRLAEPTNTRLDEDARD